MPLLFSISRSNDGRQKPWLRKRSATCRCMASVRWIPSQLMYLLGSLQVDVPFEPHNESELKLSSPPPAPQHALKGSLKWYFFGFISIARISLWIIVAELAVAAQPILSRSCGGLEEIAKGRHPTGGSP